MIACLSACYDFGGKKTRWISICATDANTFHKIPVVTKEKCKIEQPGGDEDTRGSSKASSALPSV